MYLNLFVKPDDTAAFCEANGLRLCLDISHSKLACNHFQLSLADFVDRVAPYAAHLHIADARGVDGEGLQVGEGEIDFGALWRQLRAVCPEASFMPEIWQGHRNHGEGFWVALERLEKFGVLGGGAEDDGSRAPVATMRRMAPPPTLADDAAAAIRHAA
jgi:N-acetylneuraminate synthase